MLRFIGVVVLASSFVGPAAAQDKSGASSARVAPGDYSGKLQQENGSGSSDVKLNIKHVAPDGRVTARVQATHALKPCAADLPASGITLKEGGMRLEVDAGVPEGCERIYLIKSASGGRIAGTYIDAVRTAGKLLPRSSSK